MADFTPVAAGIKPQQQMSLADMVNLAGAVQQYQQAQQYNPLQIERAQTELSRLQQLMPQEVRRATAEANVAVGKEQPSITVAEEEAKQKKMGTESAQLDLFNRKAKIIADGQISMINNPLVVAAERNPNAVNRDALTNLIKQYGDIQAKNAGIPAEEANKLMQPYYEVAQQNPAALRQFLKERHLAGLDQASRTQAMQPSGIGINTGAGGYTASTGEFSQYQPGQILPGTQYTAQLAPGTQAVARPGDQSGLPPGTPYYVGPSGQQGKLAAGISPAETAATNVVSNDWAKTQEAATAATPRIAIFQNIKKLTPDAFTGPTAERRQWVAGLAQVVGIPVAELESATTDELSKNTKLLQLAGGNTDAARSLAEFANPNNKMTKEGIMRVTNQLIGIEKMNIAKASFLGNVANDPAKYQERLNVFNQVADPRLFQESTPDEVAKMKASMSKAEIAEFGRRVQLLKQMGLAQ